MRDCDEIVATAALTQMLVSSDPTPLRRYLDPRALWISASGATRSGDELIAFVRRDTPRSTARLDAVRVRFFGATAVVVWREFSWTAAGAAGALAGVDSWANGEANGGSSPRRRAGCPKPVSDPSATDAAVPPSGGRFRHDAGGAVSGSNGGTKDSLGIAAGAFRRST
ncbi:nuclear transport factor 2 family protein [Sphingomonas sp. MMS24-JH45]